MCTGLELPALAEAFGGAGIVGAGAEAGGALLGGLGTDIGLTTGFTGALEGGALGEAAGAAGFAGGAAFGGDALGALGDLSAPSGDWDPSGGWNTPAFGGDAIDKLVPATFGDVSQQALGSALTGTPAAGGGLDLSSAMSTAMKYASPISSGISGMMGLQKQAALRKLAMQMAAKGDPWGTSGGRSLADTQLQQLMGDPGSVAAKDPAYALRIQGAQRANAQYGQDSGAMSVAGANASTDWYNQRLAQLGGLAGAGTTPGNGSSAALGGVESANTLLSDSLGSFGYGMGTMNGSGGLTPQQQAIFLALSKRPGG